jgi:hypothetical protein
MAKEQVRKVLGVTAAVFAQLGQISKEEALEMSGLDAKAFEEAANRAKKAEEELKAGKKEASFYDIVSKATAEYMGLMNK